MSDNRLKTFMLSKMNKQPHSYTFVRCLFENEQDLFINRYILSNDEHQISENAIKIGEWRECMRAITASLHNRYHLFRYDKTGNIVLIESYGPPWHCGEEVYIMNCAGKMTRFKSAKLKQE